MRSKSKDLEKRRRKWVEKMGEQVDQSIDFPDTRPTRIAASLWGSVESQLVSSQKGTELQQVQQSWAKPSCSKLHQIAAHKRDWPQESSLVANVGQPD